MDQKKPAIFAVVASLLALAIAIWKLIPQEAGITKGIAVLPFENLRPDPDNAYFTEAYTRRS
jgi:TolB-like protein